MRQDILLVSNASMDIYPNNKLSEFKVRLPIIQQFDQSYRVAVTRISFTKSYFNYEFVRGERMWNIILSDNKANYEPANTESLQKCQLFAIPLPGYYTPESFVSMINNVAHDFRIDGDDKLKSRPKYVLRNGYLSWTRGEFTNSGGHTIFWEIKFDAATSAILGIDKDPTRPVFLNQGWTDLYVYSDLVYPSIVGDRTTELLCIIDGQTEKHFGAHCTETFDDPWYHSLAKHKFSEITVYIRNDQGKAPSFKFGRVNVRLSFRKEDDL